jgi:molybdopterin-containing oxidoreductase family iron-sulfur binding subunit
MSKRVFIHPEPKVGDVTGPSYWRSLEERNKSPEFRTRAEREFLDGASTLSEVDRRSFLALMGASFGLAGLGLSGCREPRNHTLPYAKTPELTIPGVPTYFASSFPGEYANQAILVETHQRRPTKIEGNPSHAVSGTASSKVAQASVLGLYDPDRATTSVGVNGAPISSAAVRDALAAFAKDAGNGAGLAFLARPSTSPTRADLVSLIKKRFPQAIWAEYTPVDQAAGDRALGENVRVVPDFAAAKRILAIDADFLGSGDQQVEATRAYAAARRADTPEQAKEMVRLYSVESLFTLTGAAADHRLPLESSQMAAFAAQLSAEVMRLTGGSSSIAAPKLDIDPKWVAECAADLVARRGQSLVVAGAHLPAAVHQLVAQVNQQLNAVDKTVRYHVTDRVPAATIAQLVASKPKKLVILGGNPVFDAPTDLDFANTVKATTSLVRIGAYGPDADESSRLTRDQKGLFVAQSHYLEAWSDGRTLDGTYVPVQPMIAPLYDTLSELEVLATLSGSGNVDVLHWVTEKFNLIAGGFSGTSSFDAWLKEGVLGGSKFKASSIRTAAVQVTAPEVSRQKLEVRIVPSTGAGDGATANNAWLLEAPDAMSKICWENIILVSPALAKSLEIEPEPMVINKIGALNRNINQVVDGKLKCRILRVTVGGRTVEGPAFIMPGLAKWTLGLQLGYGRRVVGRAGARVAERLNEGRIIGVGFDTYPLVTAANPAFSTGATIELTAETVVVANTQDHWSMEGRDIIREGSVEDFSEKPTFAARLGVDGHVPAVYGIDEKLSPAAKAITTPRGNSAYEHPDHTVPPNVAVWRNQGDKTPLPQQWGMSIDLNTCTGCNACVTACQAENNIPVVGRDQVLKGRDMRWIRLDRYFFDGREEAGMEIPENPQVTFQAIACQHCETAPCESVCPANATVHDEQGLNTMAYNRCIGTRYCANNCPYKVRRFNFVDYNERQIGHYYRGPLGAKGMPETLKMQKNPDVSVRMRGVMEKCTYCVQRIQEAKVQAKANAGASPDTNVRDGNIQVACQQACPAGAIEFGDISDSSTRVAKAKASPRTYGALSYLNTRPRTTFQAKLRNPNLRMPGARRTPNSRLEMAGREGSHGAHSATPEGQGHTTGH